MKHLVDEYGLAFILGYYAGMVMLYVATKAADRFISPPPTTPKEPEHGRADE